MMLRTLTIVVVGMALLFSAGCAARKTFPLAARSGDTVTLFLGPGNNKTMATGTSTVEMYPVGDPSTRYYPTLRSIAYVYPDPSSKAANYHPSAFINAMTHDDLFQAIGVVDLPMAVPPGDYTVEVDGVGVDIEILSGTGQAHDFEDVLSEYIKLAIVYPEGVITPGISILSSSFYDLDGVPIAGIQPSLQ
jgi:hypothetical protein